MPSYRHTASTSAPIDVVWHVVQDHEGMAAILPPGADAVAKPWLAEEGSPDRNGVGAVRRFGKLPLGEQITEFDPPHRMAYTIVNAPIKGYEGVVQLTERSDGGTDVVWEGSFERPGGVQGAVMGRVVGTIVGGMLKKVVKVAEIRAV